MIRESVKRVLNEDIAQDQKQREAEYKKIMLMNSTANYLTNAMKVPQDNKLRQAIQQCLQTAQWLYQNETQKSQLGRGMGRLR